MKTAFQKTALSVAIASTLILAGCGGSSSSGSAPPAQQPDASATTVSGSAVKGIMKSAIVTAFELDSAGDRLPNPVGEARTNAQGEYTVSLSADYAGGLLEINISTDASTRMVCDASSCGDIAKGEDVELPDGFMLSAIVPKPATGNEISAPVTPWSTMAAKRTQALVSKGESTGQALKRATSEVQQIAGFNFANTPAKSVTNLEGASADEQQAAVMNAVVAELVFSGSDASEQFARFTRALDDGIAGNDGDGFKVAELGEQARSVISTTPGLDSSAKDALNTQATKNSSVGNEGFTPVDNSGLDVPENATQAEKITAFKQFVGQARTWASSIEELDSAALGSAVDLDLATVKAALATETVGSLALTAEIINQSLDAALIDPAEVKEILRNGGDLPLTIKDGGADVGTATLSVEDTNGLQITVKGTVNDQAQTNYLPFNLTLQTNLSVSDLDLDAAIVKRVVASAEITVDGTVSDASGFVLAELSDVRAQLNLSDVVAADTGVSDQQIKDKFRSASLRGNVVLNASTGERFSGEVEAGLTRLNSNRFVLNDTPVSIERLRIAGNFLTATGDTFAASATLNINNADSFDTFAWLDYNNAKRGIYMPVDGSLVDPLLSQLPGEAVNVNANVWVYDAYEGKQGYFDVNGSVADGQAKDIYVPISEAELPQLAAALKAGLLRSDLPSVIEFEVFNEASGQSEIKQINLPQKIQDGQVYGGHWDPGNHFDGAPVASLNANVFVDIPELNNAGSANTFIPGQGDGYVDIWYDQTSGLVISAQGLIAQSAKPYMPSNLSALQGAELVALWGDMNTGSVQLTRPAELQYYEQCIAEPQQQLPLLGYGYDLNQPYFDPEQTCGWATLNHYSNNGQLDSETIELLDAEIRGKLTEEYGAELANQVNVPYYGIWTNGANGSLNATVEFPSLETAQNFINASLTVSASVSIPELPFASVVATATRSSLNGGAVLANVSWDGGEYSLEVASDDLESATSINARFFNTIGYELALQLALNEAGDITAVTGDALLNGEDIGDVTTRNGMPVIVYPNGDETEFETLF